VFNSSFAEGHAAATSSTPTSPPHGHIVVDDPFDLFHTILHYIYSKRITFVNNLDIVLSGRQARKSPKLCSAEDIYAIADRLLLDDLKRKALDFLEQTCTGENIVARTFGELASLYPEVRVMYAKRFFKNKDVVNDPEEVRKFFAALQSLGKHNGLIYLIAALTK